MKRLLLVLLVGLGSASAQAVERVRATKMLTCAIDQGTPEYTTLDLHGPRVAFDLELCHAVAVAIGGAEAKVLPLPVPDEASALAAVETGKADLAPTVSLSFSNATRPGITLGPPILVDGTELLVGSGVTRAAALSGKKICFFAETETEGILRGWFARNRLEFVSFPFSEEGEMQAAVMTGNCPAVGGDWTRLEALRAGLGTRMSLWKLLPEMLAEDPLGPAAADAGMAKIATWVDQLLLQADAMGVSQANLAAVSEDAAVRRLLGRTHELGSPLGLDDDWPVRVLSAVGSYSQVYRRAFGVELPVRLVPGSLPLR